MVSSDDGADGLAGLRAHSDRDRRRRGGILPSNAMSLSEKKLLPWWRWIMEASRFADFTVLSHAILHLSESAIALKKS